MLNQRVRQLCELGLIALLSAAPLTTPSSSEAGIFGLWGFHPPTESPEEGEEDTETLEQVGRGTLFQWNPDAPVDGGPKINEPLVSDRPDFTEASVTVGYGVSQLEMGYTFTLDRNNGTTSQQQSYPELLLRQGLFADWFELRLEWGFNDGGPKRP
ncbi:MAG: hypothetical protein K8T91_18080 [Planctomycetes bacterium]|nr:hypothetical protein [Planctomycetota bacterium]